ncbi:hypothetical protein [Mesorhizobium sp. CN2-181]|uniref:hypothetical protein n=1 Tax=Mesorhizobium yinganensis TaxID=3157707 RepID=UPI0032B84BB9
MGFEELQTGVVISSPFLWAREAAAGETEGRKRRPVAVALRLARPGGDAVVLLPTTTQPPARERNAVEVPETEKQRAGLDTSVRCWIMLDEFNTDIIGKSYYLEPEPPLGVFSRAFFAPVARRFVGHVKAARKVDRR